MAKEITESEYKELKSSVEQARSEADRAQGVLDTLLRRLKDEHGCKDLKAAEAKLAELEVEHSRARKAFDKAFEEYTTKWHE